MTGRLLALSLLLPLAAARAGEEGFLLVRAGHLFDGERETKNATLLLRDGVVSEPGEAEGAEVLDAAGLWVTPGWVDARTTLGIRGADTELTAEVSPRFDVASAFDERDPRLRRALSAGVTTAYVSPGTENVISGLGAVVRAGDRWRVVVRRAALEVSLNADPARGNYGPRYRSPATIYSRRPTTRMGVVWILRSALLSAGGGKADPDLAVVRRALEGELPLRATARREEDIRTACRIAREFGIRGFTVVDAVEAHRALEPLVERGARVVLGPPVYSESGYGPDRSRVHFGGARALEEKGVPFAIASGGDGTGLRAAASLALRFGLSRRAALAAVTSRAAEILGVADRAGRLAPGRRADLVLFDGDPLETSSRVVRVIAGGKTVYEANDKGADR